MQMPVEISYRGVEKSDEIDALIRTKAARLDRFCDHISHCNVAVERPNQAQHSGSAFRVRVDVTVPPGHELVADEKQNEHEMHEPLAKIINGTAGKRAVRAPAALSRQSRTAGFLENLPPRGESCMASRPMWADVETHAGKPRIQIREQPIQ